MDQEEIGLIQRAQAGERRAFEELVRLHDRRILQVAYGILGNRDDAYDAYQNTFIRAFTHLKAFRFESAFSTWLTRIAINQSLNLRKKQRWRHWLSLDGPQPVPLPEAGPSDQPVQDMMNEEIAEQIQQSLSLLSDRERTVFVLKHMQGYKIREIAGMIDCAEGTVKNYLFRATQKMRNALQPLYEDYAAG
jgi:RNA polymerase sigma-70 factor (ECF subfamily)